MITSVNATENVNADTTLGQPAFSVIVDNYSGSWAYLPAADTYIRPWIYGQVVQLLAGAQTASIRWRTPPGITAAAVGSGQLATRWTTDILPPAQGLTTFATQAPMVVTGSVSGISISGTVPIGIQGGDPASGTVRPVVIDGNTISPHAVFVSALGRAITSLKPVPFAFSLAAGANTTILAASGASTITVYGYTWHIGNGAAAAGLVTARLQDSLANDLDTITLDVNTAVGAGVSPSHNLWIPGGYPTADGGGGSLRILSDAGGGFALRASGVVWVTQI